MSKFFTSPRSKFFDAGVLNPECPNCGSSSSSSGTGGGTTVELTMPPDSSYLASQDMLLDSIVINASAATTFSVGSTPGGSEIASIPVGTSPETLTLHEFLPSGTTIYFTLGSGTATLKLYFD